MSHSVSRQPSQNGEKVGDMEMDTKVAATRMLSENLSYDDMDNSDGSDEEDAHSDHIDPTTCKGKLAIIMKTNAAQYFVISLVIIDCLIIVMELLIDMEFIVFPEKDHGMDSNDTSLQYLNYTQHGDHINSSNFSFFMNGSMFNQTDDHHDPHHHTNKEKAQHALHALSLAILSIFMVEVSVKVYVERTHLLKQKAEVFDAIVVVVSFTLDVTFSFVSVSKAASEAAGLMVLLRLWRVTRIINGVIMSVKLDADKKTAVHKKARRIAEKENKKLKGKIERLERENAVLRDQLFVQNSALEETVSVLPNPGRERNSGVDFGNPEVC